jgi:large subunit ribosomal protein L21
MYAIVKVGSNQYKVAEGDTISVNRLEDKEGASITLDEVLMIVDGEKVNIGQPFVKNAKITAKVVEHDRGDKTVAFKYRRRTNYKRKKGGRADLTDLNITKISA